MFRLIENWPSLRATMMNINMDLHSIVRSIRSSTCVKSKETLEDSHAERPARLDRLLDSELATKEQQIQNSWSSDDKSAHITIHNDGLICKRRPIAKSTDCVRGKCGYTRGLHVWAIHWPAECRGTHAVVGVATESAPVHAIGYCSLVGSNTESWGWDLIRNKTYYNQIEETYPHWLTAKDMFHTPDEFMVVLDMDEGTLGFIVDNVYLGVAFNDLKGKKLYPIISTVWGNGEIGIKYMGGLEPSPLKLQECCRKVIRNQIGKNRLRRVRQTKELQLPNAIQDYILH